MKTRRQNYFQSLFRVRAILLLFVLLAFQLNLAYASSEISNKRNPYAQINACAPYLDFLQTGKLSGQDNTNCHALEKLILATSDSGLNSFLNYFFESIKPESALFAAGLTLEAVIRNEAERTFATSETAGRLITFRMASSFDEERAGLYSNILSDIKHLSLVTMCSAKYDCDSIDTTLSISQMFGPQFSDFDEVRSDHLLMCLLRTDAYVIPIRKVLGSNAFRKCIAMIG